MIQHGPSWSCLLSQVAVVYRGSGSTDYSESQENPQKEQMNVSRHTIPESYIADTCMVYTSVLWERLYMWTYIQRAGCTKCFLQHTLGNLAGQVQGWEIAEPTSSYPTWLQYWLVRESGLMCWAHGMWRFP